MNAFSLDRRLESIRIRQATLVLLMLAGAGACQDLRPYPSDQGTRARLNERVTHDAADVLDFSALAPFAWSRMYVFGSYASRESAERALGFEWKYQWPLGMQDGEALAVFVDSTRVLAAFVTMRDPVDLVPIARQEGYPRDSARFRVSRHSGTRGPVYVLTRQ